MLIVDHKRVGKGGRLPLKEFWWTFHTRYLKFFTNALINHKKCKYFLADFGFFFFAGGGPSPIPGYKHRKPLSTKLVFPGIVW